LGGWDFRKLSDYKNMKNKIIIVIIVVLVAVASSAYFIGHGSNNLVENQKQCATDGKVFFQNWLQTALMKGDLSDSPEYHFSRKLNTCLVYVGKNNIWSPSGGSTSNYNVLYIYDIYTNKPILQSWTLRTCNGDQCIERIETPYFSDVQNVGNTDFFAKKKVVMSE